MFVRVRERKKTAGAKRVFDALKIMENSFRGHKNTWFLYVCAESTKWWLANTMDGWANRKKLLSLAHATNTLTQFAWCDFLASVTKIAKRWTLLVTLFSAHYQREKKRLVITQNGNGLLMDMKSSQIQLDFEGLEFWIIHLIRSTKSVI
jgi:hypothetical protein